MPSGIKLSKSRTAKRFVSNIELELDSLFYSYACAGTRVKNAFVPAFWYEEQRTKTFLTIALARLCGGIVLQEAPIDRKNDRKIISKNCRADYYGEYCQWPFLLEFKQKWVKDGQRALNTDSLLKGHNECIEQIKNIKNQKSNKDWAAKCYIAMSLCCVWQDSSKEIEASNIEELKKKLLDTSRSKKEYFELSSVGYISSREFAKKGVEFKTGYKKKDTIEYYPGCFVLWTVIDGIS